MKKILLPLVVFATAAAASPVAADDQEALVKRGAYLVNGPAACANCHTPRNPDFSLITDKNLAGGFHLVDPAFDVYSANITPDKATGIGNWTDEQIMRAIRQGIDDEGKVIFPPMPVPTYNNMSDDDVKAIVAYLHTVPAVQNKVPESKWNIPQQAMPPPKGAPAPSAEDKVAYGGYLVNAVAHCFECHTTPDEHGVPDVAHHLGAGGFKIALAPGMDVMTPNITSDKETGIGNWTAADIKKALTDGVTPTGQHLSPPMPFPWFKNMTDQDLDAIVAYVQTLPPISNKVERTDFQKTAFK
ncbi:MAG TPA: c-type cytochrome [Devosia sp.]|jgi:mono/diheme cytochrome c family protein|nr:c-type cytochrome [Devosia sp.]